MDEKHYDPVYGYEGADTEAAQSAQQAAQSVQQTAPLTDGYDIRRGRARSFRRGILVGVCSMLAVCLVAGVIIYRLVLPGGIGRIYTEDVGDKAGIIESLIDEYYYVDVDEETLTEGIYAGIVDSLGDKYSAYYTPEQYAQLMIDTTGNYGGIGATLTKNEDTGEVQIVNIYDGVPAEKAGLRAGDILISADGHLAVDMELDSFVQIIRGEAGTTVEIVYERDGQQGTVTVTRERISIPSVSYRMLDGDIGYIRITEFMSGTREEFDEAIEELTAQGMTAVIFDLRSNPGGLLDSVTDILDSILPEGTTVYMETKSGERTTYTSDAQHYIDIPIAVLVNENSASASEIFAGAIRDYEYGTLIGTTTYGKGVVQSTIPLTDGSAVKLTIAQYFTPSGECIQGIGITPDIELELEYTGDPDADEYDYGADNQVQKAIEVLRQ